MHLYIIYDEGGDYTLEKQIPRIILNISFPSNTSQIIKHILSLLLKLKVEGLQLIVKYYPYTSYCFST